MKYQQEVHDDSWKSRKPDRETVTQKPRVKATLSLLEDLISDGDQIFDLGCGDGTVGTLLKDHHNVTIDGCDVSKVAVDRAQNHYRNTYQLNIDDEDIPIKSGSYDIVICTDVLEHVLSPIHALIEIKRLLKDDGVAVFSVPNYGFIRYRIHSMMGKIPSVIRDERHHSAFTVYRLRDLLSDSGLEIQTTLGVSRLQRLAKIHPSLFAKTIIVTATLNGETGRADALSNTTETEYK